MLTAPYEEFSKGQKKVKLVITEQRIGRMLIIRGQAFIIRTAFDCYFVNLI